MEYKLKQPVYNQTSGCGGPGDCATKQIMHNSKIQNKINNLNRNKVLLTQTPQCFNFKELFDLYKLNKEKITDEASLYLNNNKKIKFILGDKKPKDHWKKYRKPKK